MTHDYLKQVRILILRLLREAVTPEPLGMSMPGTLLPRRIRRMLNERPSRPISRLRVLATVMAATILTTTFVAGTLAHAQRTGPVRPTATSAIPAPAGTPAALTESFPIKAIPAKPVLVAQAQTPAPVKAAPTPAPARFEVATIKPSGQTTPGGFIRAPQDGRLTIPNMTLLELIRFAYAEGLGFNLQISGGPGWVNQTRYDVDVKAPNGTPSLAEYRVMLRTLMADRFALKMHTESKPIDVFALVLARSDGKLSPNLKTWDETCNGQPPPTNLPNPKGPHCGAFFRPDGMAMEGVSMGVVADMLSSPPSGLDRQVVDRTGLTGIYTFHLDFQFRRPDTPAGAAAADPFAPSLFTALQEQLGLKLESAKGTTDVYIVDSAERPSEN
jgi:uncharacterized protein (TIGR03435 family)